MDGRFLVIVVLIGIAAALIGCGILILFLDIAAHLQRLIA